MWNWGKRLTIGWWICYFFSSSMVSVWTCVFISGQATASMVPEHPVFLSGHAKLFSGNLHLQLSSLDLIWYFSLYQTHSDTGMWIAHVPLCIFALHLIKILIPVYYGHLCTLSLCLCPSIRYSVPLLFRIFFWQIWSHSIRSLSIHMKYIQIIHDPWSISSSLSSIQGLVTLDKCELDAVPLWLVKGRID